MLAQPICRASHTCSIDSGSAWSIIRQASVRGSASSHCLSSRAACDASWKRSQWQKVGLTGGECANTLAATRGLYCRQTKCSPKSSSGVTSESENRKMVNISIFKMSWASKLQLQLQLQLRSQLH